jgi:hypothetical protein
MRCEHCNTEIKDLHRAWNRQGYHWCDRLCYEQDEATLQTELRKPVMRKKNIKNKL